MEPERPSRLGPVARWWRSAIAIHQNDAVQAVKTIQVFIVFCVVANCAYTAVYLLSDPATLSHVLGVNLTATIAFIVAGLLARAGRQFAAALLCMSVAGVEVLLCTSFLGWSAGFHLFLLTAGQLVFMVFTDRQAVFRWLVLISAAAIFVFCQFSIGHTLGPDVFTEETRTVLFSLNVVITGAVLYGLATIAHLRGKGADAEAHAATARAEYLANTDALTGLMNRRPVMQEFERLDALESGSYSVGIADLDRFKELNDSYGHTCGDRVLAAVGRAFRTNVRSTDIVGRWGGEEFIFVLPGAAVEDATVLMERLRLEIEGLTITCGDHAHTTTASFGIADGQAGSLSFRVVKRADDAMYEAKASGRNAVCVSPASGEGDETPSPPDRGTPRSLRVRGPEA